jgi:hypothetical protein
VVVSNFIRVNWSRGLLVVLSVLFIGACGGSDSPDGDADGGGGTVGLDEALDQVIELYDEILDVLAGVTKKPVLLRRRII